MRVFVYGTLKRGHANHHVLEGATFVGEAVTVAKCRLYHAGFPVLRKRSERPSDYNAPVQGEVYEFTDPAILQRLDRLEGEGRMYHRRVKLVTLHNGKTHKAYAYVGDTQFWTRGRYLLRYGPNTDGHYVWPSEPVHTTY